MKKIVAITSFCFFFGALLNAQSSDLRLGFQVSPSFSFMATDDNQINSNGTNLGLKLGMIAEMYFQENYAFFTGLGFAFNSGGTLRHEQGGQIWTRSELPQGVNPTFFTGVDLKYNIQYVEIPFGLKFRTNSFGYLRYWAEIPVLTLGFRSQDRGAIMQPGTNKDKIIIKKEVGALALSWGLGGGVEYELSPNASLVGGINYQRIFTDVTRDVSDDDSKGYTSHIILRIGVMF